VVDDGGGGECGPPRPGVTVAVVGVHGSGRNARAMLRRLVAAVSTKNDDVDDEYDDDDERDGEHDDDDDDDERTTAVANSNGGAGGEILIIAPWFLSPADDAVVVVCPPPAPAVDPPPSSPPYLRWVDDPHGPLGIEHSFRYGAESIIAAPTIEGGGGGGTDDATTAESTARTTISSYAAMDILIETLCDRTMYPNLERISVVGHSAGGQLVHRWALTSGSWCFGDADADGEEAAEGPPLLPSVRVVSANPRSYTYMDGRRYLPASAAPSAKTDDDDGISSWDDGGGGGGGGGRAPSLSLSSSSSSSSFNGLVFRHPTESEFDECRNYNRYMWGLEDNPDLPAPYVVRNLERLMTTRYHRGGRLSRDSGDGNDAEDALFCRYAARDVVYLSGERDTDMLQDQISNGDGYQGPSRGERCERYHASLQVRGNEVLSRDRRRRGDDVADEEEDGRGPRMNNNARDRAKAGFRPAHAEGREVRVHRRIVVKGVGHNGGLMFQSEEGRTAMILLNRIF
jgi:hypothetical protein